MADLFCEVCKHTMREEQFYVSNNREKYPKNGGKMTRCKKCLTMHVDNWNPDTYLWILEEIDVPYVPDEWHKLMATYCKNPEKVTGTTIIGRYVAKMKLKQYNEYRWKDTEFLRQLAEMKQEQAMKSQGYSAAEITQALEEKNLAVPGGVVPAAPVAPPPPAADDYFGTMNEGPDDLDINLTEEEKTELRLKWGKMYKPEEWVKLEQLYMNMMDSYDIQMAGHLDTLKLVCKTSLKANQLLDMGDVEGAQKMVKMYDGLMKSGKFTAAQNKAESGEFVDSVSELVAICEKDGFIPRYYTDGPQDKVDRTLQDLQGYTRTLVTEEMNLGNMIETALKQIMEEKEKEAEEGEDLEDEDTLLENNLFSEESAGRLLEDEDFIKFKEEEEEKERIDEEYLEKLINGEME